jgi:hypothetical protein
MAYIGNFPASTQTVDFKWQSVQTSAFSAVTGKGYFVNTTSGAITVTLPSSANIGDAIAIVDYAGTFATNNITLTSSLNIEGSTNDKILTTNREGVTITYADATQGWVATSGVNSGDQAIDPITYSADFLVVAGGGAGGGNVGGDGAGGGGAGGYRTSTQSLIPATAITVTVGDGGTSDGTNIGTSGSSSSISGSGITTITSAGGGAGGAGQSTFNGLAGGSGGGAGYSGTGGAGNTPATTPLQGYAGGDNNNSNGGSGGGGSSAVGTAGSGSNSGVAGGAGTASSITGSSVTYAGGGGGGSYTGAGGAGGSGGGGAGGAAGAVGVAGSANTGGGGGGSSVGVGGAGGKGVVILSVPTADYSGTTTGSPTVTTSGSNTIMQFNGSGSYTA